MHKNLFTISFLILWMASSYAQEHCGVDSQWTSRHTPLKRSNATSHQQFQIAFHIVLPDSVVVSEEQLLKQLEVAANGFNARYINMSIVPDLFQNSIGSLDISFCLHSIDRKTTDVSNFASTTDPNGVRNIKQFERGGLDAIEPSEVINVWIGELEGELGISTFPDAAGQFRDGIVIDPKTLPQSDTLGSKYLGKVLIHELGHYFGLSHIWGNNRGCDSDDAITDTPDQDGPYFGCPSGPQVSCESIDMHMNYMDFTDDVCLQFFTKGQVELMQTVIENERSSLISCSDQQSMDSILTNIEITANGNQLDISYPKLLEDPVELYIFDIFGNQLYRNTYYHVVSEIISTDDFVDGVYFIQFYQNSNSLSRGIRVFQQ